MMRKWFCIGVVLIGLILAESVRISAIGSDDGFYCIYKYSNNNFTLNSRRISDNNEYTYNYNRLRNDFDCGWENRATFQILFDIENYLGKSYITDSDFQNMKDEHFDMPFNPYRYIIDESDDVLRTYLYRAYATFYLPRSSLTIGLQRIPLGIGQIWSPTDIVNPLNPLSLEPSERLGVCGAEYTYELSFLAQFKAFFTLDDNSHRKDLGCRLKANYKGWDIAVSTIKNSTIQLTGLELEREFFDTGIEVRSELARIDDDTLDKPYNKGIVGFAYCFPNSTYLVFEYLYNGYSNEDGKTYTDGNLDEYGSDQTDGNLDEGSSAQNDRNAQEQLSDNYLGTTLSYDITPLIILSTSIISNLDDRSFFTGFSCQWNIFENTDLDIGTHIYSGSGTSEFGNYENIYYLRVSNYF